MQALTAYYPAKWLPRLALLPVLLISLLAFPLDSFAAGDCGSTTDNALDAMFNTAHSRAGRFQEAADAFAKFSEVLSDGKIKSLSKSAGKFAPILNTVLHRLKMGKEGAQAFYALYKGDKAGFTKHFNASVKEMINFVVKNAAQVAGGTAAGTAAAGVSLTGPWAVLAPYVVPVAAAGGYWVAGEAAGYVADTVYDHILGPAFATAIDEIWDLVAGDEGEANGGKGPCDEDEPGGPDPPEGEGTGGPGNGGDAAGGGTGDIGPMPPSTPVGGGRGSGGVGKLKPFR